MSKDKYVEILAPLEPVGSKKRYVTLNAPGDTSLVEFDDSIAKIREKFISRIDEKTIDKNT